MMDSTKEQMKFRAKTRKTSIRRKNISLHNIQSLWEETYRIRYVKLHVAYEILCTLFTGRFVIVLPDITTHHETEV